MSAAGLSKAQHRALMDLVTGYDRSGDGVSCRSLAGAVLAELPPEYVEREDWGGLFAPRWFPTDAGRAALKDGAR